MKKRLLYVLSLVFMWVLVSGFTVEDDDGREKYYVGNMQCLRPYVAILDEINDEYGTDFVIPNATLLPGITIDEQSLITYYTSIGIDGFKEFIIENYVKNNKKESVSEDAGIAPAVFNGRQYAYFSNGNALYIDTAMYTVNGVDYYSKVSNYGDSIKSYPAYVAREDGFSYAFLEGYRKVDCKFSCYLFLNPTLQAAVTARTIRLEFTAGEGNIYPSV